MPAPATLRPWPLGPPRWRKLVVVAVLLAAAGCSGTGDTPSTPKVDPVATHAYRRHRHRRRPGALWVTCVAPGDLGAPGKDAVARIDPATGRTVAIVTVGRAPLDLAVTPGAVWVTNAGGGGDRVARIDPSTAPR